MHQTHENIDFHEDTDSENDTEFDGLPTTRPLQINGRASELFLVSIRSRNRKILYSTSSDSAWVFIVFPRHNLLQTSRSFCTRISNWDEKSSSLHKPSRCKKANQLFRKAAEQ